MLYSLLTFKGRDNLYDVFLYRPEVVSRYRDRQLQLGKNSSYLFVRFQTSRRMTHKIRPASAIHLEL